MITGSGEWPMPIPIVKAGSAWRFDTVAGRQEILFRRIGRNELDAIQVAGASSRPRTSTPRRDATARA